jgi:hypothetical protein
MTIYDVRRTVTLDTPLRTALDVTLGTEPRTIGQRIEHLRKEYGHDMIELFTVRTDEDVDRQASSLSTFEHSAMRSLADAVEFSIIPDGYTIGETIALYVRAAVNRYQSDISDLLADDDLIGDEYRAAERKVTRRLRYVERQVFGRAVQIENWL